MLSKKLVPLIAIALTAASCVDMGQMSGQPGASQIGNAPSPPTFYQGGSYDKVLNNVVVQGGDKATRITVHATIAPNGADSWMRDAPWNEVVLTVQNLTHREIDVVAIHGVTAQGAMVDQGGMDAFTAVEQQRATTMQTQFEQQDQAPPPAQPGADLGAMMASSMTTALGLPYVPPVGAAPAVTAQQQKARQDSQDAALKQQADDFQNVSGEYTKRSLQQAKLAAKGEVTGSAFFPVSSGAITGIVVSVLESRHSEDPKDITLALPAESTPAETASGAAKAPQ
jgi:hypothetical protein